MVHKGYNIQTKLCHLGEENNSRGAVIMPIYQNSTFTFDSWDDIDQAFEDPYNNSIYTRGNNPTVTCVEKKIAELCYAESAKLFTSGMSAISSAILSCVKQGDHIVTINNIYGPANNFLSGYLKEKMGIQLTYIDGRNPQEFLDSIQSNTTLFYLESPTYANFTLLDLEQIANIAKSQGIKTIIDNTWSTPYFQNPLKLGIDLEVHSASKYLSGHSDIVAGVIAGSQTLIESIFSREHAWLGGKIAPFEAWLINRSLRTFTLRMDKHQENALKVSKFLYKHDAIESVSYPGLRSFDQYPLALKQMNGFSGLMSFRLKTKDMNNIKAFVNSLKLFKLGVSWGGHESLVYTPAISFLKELNQDQFESMGISLGDIRISVGLEHHRDLIADLKEALKFIKD